jgi:hypothetical protein
MFVVGEKLNCHLHLALHTTSGNKAANERTNLSVACMNVNGHFCMQAVVQLLSVLRCYSNS